ncbi:hypothetical protein BSKO_10785 [Bryopsis sp. KO-2023]|nr:hypothetical protein BSKO_10785 [Bryopsis sp. KO-2023]
MRPVQFILVLLATNLVSKIRKDASAVVVGNVAEACHVSGLSNRRFGPANCRFNTRAFPADIAVEVCNLCNITRESLGYSPPELKPFGKADHMTLIRQLGRVGGVQILEVENQDFLRVVWDSFLTAPDITVAAKTGGDIFAPVAGEIASQDLESLAVEPLELRIFAPSPNTIDGNVSAGAIHILAAVKNGESEKCDAISAQGCLMSFSILLQSSTHFPGPSSDGSPSPLDTFLTEQLHDVVHAPGFSDQTSKAGSTLDLDALLPAYGEYVAVKGSLEMDQCKLQPALWHQFLTPVMVSPEQLMHVPFHSQIAVLKSMLPDPNECTSKLKASCRLSTMQMSDFWAGMTRVPM